MIPDCFLEQLIIPVFMLKINFHFVLLLVLSIFCSNCAIRYFNDSEYNPIGLVEDNTISDRTPINQILDEKTELIGKKIYDVKAYVAIYSECLMETQNIQSIALNYHGDPCLEFPIGYQRFRFFEIMVGKENDISLDTLYFFLSEKLSEKFNPTYASSWEYERARIYYFVSEGRDSLQKPKVDFLNFNRYVRKHKSMFNGKMKTSRNSKDNFQFYFRKDSVNQCMVLNKIVSKSTNKISGTKPLIYDVNQILFDDSNPLNGMKLYYDPKMSTLTQALLDKKVLYRSKN